MSFARSFYALVSFYAIFDIKKDLLGQVLFLVCNCSAVLLLYKKKRKAGRWDDVKA